MKVYTQEPQDILPVIPTTFPETQTLPGLEEFVKTSTEFIITPPPSDPMRSLRDERGLMKSVQYKFTPEGLVDYKSMLKPEHLYVLNDHKATVEKKFGKTLSEINLLEVEEKYLCITLQGIRYLANIRGYRTINSQVNNVVYDHNWQAVVSCTVTTCIQWIGNYETNGESVTSCDVAGAARTNTMSFAQKYVESIAANRAFARAVRSFLNIKIVAQDEVGPSDPLVKIDSADQVTPASSHDPKIILQNKIKSVGLTFEDFKVVVSKKYKDKITSNPDEWNSYKDIPNNEIFKLLGLIAETEEKKKN